MDKHNLFFTPATYRLARLDWAIVMAVLIALLVIHWREVDWWSFTIAFLASDLIGTFPGMYVYYLRRKGDRRSIPAIFHILYNVGHSFAAVAIATLAWYLVAGEWQWAMLAMPIHLAGDRSVFGNIYKPLGTAFEPVAHEAFLQFQNQYRAAGKW